MSDAGLLSLLEMQVWHIIPHLSCPQMMMMMMMMIQWAAELRPTFSNCLNMCVELSTEVVSLDSSGCIAIHGFWCHWWKTL
jgi:hypothetical protein